jgi:hypothetical protein
MNGTQIANSSFYSGFANWSATTSTLKIVPNSNAQQGNYTVAVIFNDSISIPSNLTFNLEVIPDYPLVQIGQVAN